MKCWNIGTWAGPLRVRPYTDQCNTEGQPEATRHEIQDSRRLLLTLYDFCARQLKVPTTEQTSFIEEMRLAILHRNCGW